MGIMKNFLGDDSLTDDKYLALSMLAGAKAGASAYLMGALESATPEIRHLYGGYSTQITQSHEALTNLAVQRGWYSAYGDPKTQLQEVVSDSMKFTTPNA